MQTRISWLVAATSSAIILAFVIPMCLLVRTLAEDRAVAQAQQQAQGVATIVSSIDDEERVADALQQGSPNWASATSVLLPSGRVIGLADPDMGRDPLVRQALTQMAAFTDRSGPGTAVLVPVALPEGTAVVRTNVSAEEMHEGVTVAWVSIIALGLALLLISLLIARMLARRIGTPVSDLARTAHRLRSGEFDVRVVPAGPEEVREVGTAFNQLADRIGDLLAAEREVVADLSHRLRTPVTALRLDSETVTDPEISERLRDHVDQLQRTIDAVIHEARRPVRSALRGQCDLEAIAAERVRFWGPLAEDQERVLTFRSPGRSVPVALDADDVRDLLDNLVDNVFAHSPEGASLEVEVEVGADGQALLRVQDAGPGFPDPGAAAERGASSSGSSGLGLDIVRRIARDSGGGATLGRSPSGGASVTVTLGRPTG